MILAQVWYLERKEFQIWVYGYFVASKLIYYPKIKETDVSSIC
jgi:hypothetical protein